MKGRNQKEQLKKKKKRKTETDSERNRKRLFVETIIEEKLNCIIRAGSSKKDSEKKASLGN